MRFGSYHNSETKPPKRSASRAISSSSNTVRTITGELLRDSRTRSSIDTGVGPSRPVISRLRREKSRARFLGKRHFPNGDAFGEDRLQQDAARGGIARAEDRDQRPHERGKLAARRQQRRRVVDDLQPGR